VSYLIDGSNLGGQAGGARGARDPAAVVRWLLPWARQRSGVVVFFDGPPQVDIAARYGALEVRFTAPLSADQAILRALGKSPRGKIVVTADRALAHSCRDLGAKVESAESLLGRTAKTHRRIAEEGEKPTPSGADQEYWKKVFGGG
jgi:predicted RNA-binding protein with PIN domain